MATPAQDNISESFAEESGSPEGSIIDPELSARKRAEVGLSPQRPTANSAPLRPPRTDTGAAPRAILPAFLGVILVATMFLVLANMWDWFPNWWHAPAIVAESVHTVTVPLGEPVQIAGYQLVLSDDFSQPDTAFAEGEQSGEWRIEHTPTAASYRMEVWPNRVVWSLLDVADPDLHRTQASMAVATHTPWGYAGLVNRYSDEDNFYLFMVDGQGRYMVQKQESGSLTTLVDWTRVDFLNMAGSTNTLTIDDDGMVQRFYGNNMLLYETPAQLPAGATGLAGGAQQEGAAEISFDWIQLFDLLTY
jgi:hypothetical protein